MRTDLLLRFADLLEADANNPEGVKFDLGAWAQDSRINLDNMTPDEVDELLYSTTTETIPVSCGTAACALGLAAISGAFKDEGLSWKIIPGYQQTTGALWPTFDGRDGFEAGEALFEIDSNTAEHLFSPGYYDVNKGREAELEVARRVRGLVDGTWKAPDLENWDDDDDED